MGGFVEVVAASLVNEDYVEVRAVAQLGGAKSPHGQHCKPHSAAARVLAQAQQPAGLAGGFAKTDLGQRDQLAGYLPVVEFAGEVVETYAQQFSRLEAPERGQQVFFLFHRVAGAGEIGLHVATLPGRSPAVGPHQ